jgi:hypothetical protein
VSTISGQREISTITYDVTVQKAVVFIDIAVRICRDNLEGETSHCILCVLP